MQDQTKSGMQCVEFEALLAEALDATLPGTTMAAFEAHQKECEACAAMYEQAVAGVHANDLRHLDLSAKGLQKTYYSTEARVVRYYENIRLVYEIESRVRDLRRAATPEKQEETTPKSPSKNNGSQEQDRKYQNYSRDVSQPVLASCPVVDEQETPQARLNRRTA